MPRRVLTITSPTNAHALAAYAGITALGILHTLVGPGEALRTMLTPSIASTLMGILIVGGLTCFSAAVVGSRERDPTLALTVEIGTLSILAVTLLLFFVSLIRFYGTDAPTTTVVVGMFLVGSIARVLQAGHERALLDLAKQQISKRAVEVTTELDRE